MLLFPASFSLFFAACWIECTSASIAWGWHTQRVSQGKRKKKTRSCLQSCFAIPMWISCLISQSANLMSFMACVPASASLLIPSFGDCSRGKERRHSFPDALCHQCVVCEGQSLTMLLHRPGAAADPRHEISIASNSFRRTGSPLSMHAPVA
jgi:hypothetical protein